MYLFQAYFPLYKMQEARVQVRNTELKITFEFDLGCSHVLYLMISKGSGFKFRKVHHKFFCGDLDVKRINTLFPEDDIILSRNQCT